MKEFLKSLLAVALITTAFMVGFQLGKEQEKQKIPKFQEDRSEGDGLLE